MYGLTQYPPVYGEHWVMTGRVFPLRKRRGALSYGLRTGLRNSRRVLDTAPGIAARLMALRTKAAAMLSAGIEKYPQETGVIQAMLLGVRARLPQDVRESFRHTGTMHVFAVSGLHVGILCAIVVFAVSVMGVPRTMWGPALAPFVFSYTFITGSRASAIRAGIMAVAYLAASLLRRRPDAVSSFCFAAILILFVDPLQLTQIGFIFSFTVVAGILAVVPVLDRLSAPLWSTDPFMLPEDVAKNKWRLFAERHLIGLCSVSLAAWLTSAPLAMHFFGRFSPIALPGNLLAVPLAFLIIVTGCLSLVGGLLVPQLGEIFNYANLIFVKILVGGMRLLEKVPYGWFDCGQLPLWGVFLWYLLLAITIYLLRRKIISKHAALRDEERRIQ